MDRTDLKKPGVLVIHEVFGLNPHMEDICRRLAKEGFMAMAPDALSPEGGTPDDRDLARGMVQKLDKQSNLDNYLAASKYLRTHPASTQKTGCMGFCWGGAMANQMAVHDSDLLAAIPYYGSQPATADVPKIRASLLLHYADPDDRINQGIPEFESALKKAGTDYRLHLYKGAQHGFNNDAETSRYHHEAAETAWQRSIAFLNEKLKT
jgi:carboxymethylenebutenolidase